MIKQRKTEKQVAMHVTAYPGSKKILCQYWFDNYLLTNYWDLGFQYQVNIEPISR